MTTNVSLDTSAHPSTDSPTYPGRDRREATQYDGSEQADNKAPLNAESLQLKNTTVVLEHGPAGTIGRVERGGRTEYAGPLPSATVQALREVST